MHGTTIIWVLVIVSEFVAIALARRIWMSDDPTFMKVALTIVAFIPVLGPLAVFWSSNFPPPQPEALMDQSKYTADVHDRWSAALKEKNEAKRQIARLGR